MPVLNKIVIMPPSSRIDFKLVPRENAHALLKHLCTTTPTLPCTWPMVQLFSDRRGAKRAIWESLDEFTSCRVRVVCYVHVSNGMYTGFTTEL